MQYCLMVPKPKVSMIAPLLFFHVSDYFLKMWESTNFPVHNDWGSHYFQGVITNCYIGMFFAQ